MSLIEIENLGYDLGAKKILHGIDLKLFEGEIVTVVGPNGSGKSTLSNVLAGKSGYTIIQGSVDFCGEDLISLEPNERANKGIFLAFQYPVEIPGVATSTFVRTALNAQRRHRGEDELDAIEFLKLARARAKELEMSEDFFKREVNVGFSGGEKKRAEVFQMSMLSPILAILDETDSGLDIDALRIVANGVNKLKSSKNAVILITHYQRLLDYIVPDYVHVLHNGKIVKSGTKELAIELEEKGYDWIKEEVKN